MSDDGGGCELASASHTTSEYVCQSLSRASLMHSFEHHTPTPRSFPDYSKTSSPRNRLVIASQPVS